MFVLRMQGNLFRNHFIGLIFTNFLGPTLELRPLVATGWIMEGIFKKTGNFGSQIKIDFLTQLKIICVEISNFF